MERFLKNNDGTVTDSKTGLIWQEETIDPMSWDEAVEYCRELRLCEKNDWRLPTIEELIALIDFSKYAPATVLPKTSLSDYWSSTTRANISDLAWYVGFYAGYVGLYYKSYTFYVRAVRDGQLNQISE